MQGERTSDPRYHTANIKKMLTGASRARNALARFDQVQDVPGRDRDLGFANILEAARYYEVEVKEENWRQLGKRPPTRNPAQE